MTDATLDSQKISVISKLSQLHDFIITGGTVMQCADIICAENDWNYVTSEEMKIIEAVHNYYTCKKQ